MKGRMGGGKVPVCALALSFVSDVAFSSSYHLLMWVIGASSFEDAAQGEQTSRTAVKYIARSLCSIPR